MSIEPVVFTLPVALRSKSNHRMGEKFSVHREFETIVSAYASRAKTEGWPCLDKGVSMSRRPKFVLTIVASSMLDSANFSKSVADALEGVLMVNDAQILTTHTLSSRSKKGQRCSIGVAVLEGDTWEDQMEASRLLAPLVVAEFLKGEAE